MEYGTKIDTGCYDYMIDQNYNRYVGWQEASCSCKELFSPHTIKLISKCQEKEPSERADFKEILENPLFAEQKRFWDIILHSDKKELFNSLAPIDGKMADKLINEPAENILKIILKKSVQNYFDISKLYYQVANFFFQESEICKGFELTLYLLVKRALQKLSTLYHYIKQKKAPDHHDFKIICTDSEWENSICKDEKFVQNISLGLKKCMELYTQIKNICTKLYLYAPIDSQILFNDNHNEYFGQVLASKTKLLVKGIIQWIKEGQEIEEKTRENLLKHGYHLWLLYTMENKFYVDYTYDIEKIDTLFKCKWYTEFRLEILEAFLQT